ncbi:MAG TPA: hypothetical protein VNK46_12505 [Nitrospiraceae bacterium]|nr:hypothetical protein [Nitrospiraceae bacterium]
MKKLLGAAQMTTAEKIALVRHVVPRGARQPGRAVLGLPRSTWYYRQAHGQTYAEKHTPLRAGVDAIAREHPAYGYR